MPRFDTGSARLLVVFLCSGFGLAGCSNDIEQTTSGLAILEQPTRTVLGGIISPAIQAAVLDQNGQTDESARDPITISVKSGAPSDALKGSKVHRPVHGIATFDDLRLVQRGSITLQVSIPGAVPILSQSFQIWQPYSGTVAGFEHTCGLGTNGVAYCWGSNIVGQRGDPFTAHSTSDVGEVAVPPGITFAALAAGAYHTCALTTGHVVYCWGHNIFNQLGNGTNSNSHSPTAVVAPGITFTSIDGGVDHTCAITTTASVYCWGLNVYGQLGDGTTITPTTPIQAGSGLGLSFQSVSAGFQHTCALTTAGVAWCWGENPEGALGDGSTTARTSPVVVTMPPGIAFVAITAGTSFSCALTALGDAYCWGRNGEGQLGDSSTTTRLTPVRVAAPTGMTFEKVLASSSRTCGITKTPVAGTIYCWGLTPGPVSAPAGLTFAGLELGQGHSCALTPTGEAYCWGDNGSGKLGILNGGPGITEPVTGQ